MAILELRILPPLAIGRLGSSPMPLDAFELTVEVDRPLDYRRIRARPTLVVVPDGSVASTDPPRIRFKDPDGRIRPVAPFLEVFARTDGAPDVLVPLTLGLLKQEKLGVEHLTWSATVGNLKIARRTSKAADKIIARIEAIRDHEAHALRGRCDNFIEGKFLPLGSVRFVRPTEQFPEIRFRFTPAAGKVYGSARKRATSATTFVDDPVIVSDDLVLYDTNKGTWRGHAESTGPTLTNPGQIFAGYDQGDAHVSWGYFDDECDGIVSVTLAQGDGRLTASAHVVAGPPAFAPDTLPPRVVSDELEQILLGPNAPNDVPIADALELVRRGLESVRLMNTAVMNGNPVNGRERVASTMVSQDTNDFGRRYEPIMAPTIADNLAVQALHEHVFTALSAGAAPWFPQALRRPDEIGDLSDGGRRKMPALMRNADARYLTFTHRQIDSVKKAGSRALFGAPDDVARAPEGQTLRPSNLTAQLHYRARGNPASSLPRAAISNCFPGLEYDFRNLWRRTFVGIVLLENNNYVVAAEDEQYADLVSRRLLRVDGKPTVVVTKGPTLPRGSNEVLATGSNPNAVSFMEWSNSLAHVLQKQGQRVICEFTDQRDASVEVLPSESTPTKKVELVVRRFFRQDTAELAENLLQAGELTQGLCSPWQNDYRECACYYWAASRPDYVNVEPGTDGVSHGDMWMAKKRTGTYIPDDRTDGRLLSYDDLFRSWEQLHFIIRGRDADETDAVDA